MNAFSPDPANAMTAVLMEGRLTDPFVFLGPYGGQNGPGVRTFQPGAMEVHALQAGREPAPLRKEADGLFAGLLPGPGPYRLRIRWPEAVQETEDPYAFGLMLGDMDLHLFMGRLPLATRPRAWAPAHGRWRAWRASPLASGRQTPGGCR